MKLEEKVLQQLQEDLKKCQTMDDLLGKDGAIKKLIKNAVEQMLQCEMTEHLGYEKHAPEGRNTGNSRNGVSPKSLKSDFGKLEIEVPRDRNGEFDPTVVKKNQTDLGFLDEKIISMYARGMTVRDIQAHLQEIYGIEVSPTFISKVTEKILSLVEEWQARPLSEVYPIIFLDAIHYKVRDNGRVVSKAAYTCLGIDQNGRKDFLGLWIGESEGANFWLSVLTELKNRGVQDILIACVDGLKGFPEAITTVFPGAEVQLCIIHQIRNSLRYISYKNQKEFMVDLKKVYTAPTEAKAEHELNSLADKWGQKYPLVINSWKRNWPNLSTYYKYPPEIRTIIYTTNAVENLHRQFRKVTKTRSAFPHDDALRKLLYLAYRDVAKKWTMPLRNWPAIISHLSLFFEGRLVLGLS
jgi:putative transposase